MQMMLLQTTGLWLLLCFWFCGAWFKVESVAGKVAGGSKKIQVQIATTNEF
jgi:hypothetical protein